MKDSLPFFGREGELEAIEGALDHVRRGRAGLVMIEGEAGIGKSRFIEVALSAPNPMPLQVFACKCEEYERARAFASLCTAFGCAAASADPRRASIASLVSTIAAAQDLSNRHFQVIDQLSALIEDLALTAPVVLVVDDLQWADEGTIAALRSFARRLSHTSVGIIAATRPVSAASLRRLAADWIDAGALEIRIGALSDDEVKALLSASFDAEPDAQLLGLVRGAAGNPLFLTELIAALQREGNVEVDGARAALSSVTQSPELDMLILRRLSFLSDAALETLRRAALFGGSFAPPDLATITGRSLGEIAGSIEESVRAHLLEEDGDRLRFRHDLIREALYRDIPEGVRHGLHGEAARALANAGAPLGQVARQYTLGARPGDLDAVRVMRRAALEEELSPSGRVELLHTAQSLLKEDDPLWSELEADVIETLVWGGHSDEGQVRARALLSTTDDARMARRLRSAAVQGLQLGARWVELAELIDRWLADETIEGPARIELLAASAYARGMSASFDARETEQIGRAALTMAEREQDEELTLRALIGLVPALTRLQSPETVPIAERAVQIAELRGIPSRDRPLWHLGLKLVHLVGPDQAMPILRRGLSLAEREGQLADVPLYLAALAEAHAYREDWDEALAHAEAAIAAAEEVGTLQYVISSHAVCAHILIHRGELRDADRHIAAEEAIADQLGAQAQPVHLSHRAMVHEMRGDLASALALRWQIFQIESRQGFMLTPWFRLMFLALRAGDRVKADAVTGWLETARAEGTDTQRAEARLARGMRDRDAAMVRSNLHALTGIGGGMVHERTALACGWVGLHQEALEHFDTCREALERLGAHPWVDHVARLLRELGVAVPRRKRRARATSGWESLTDAERRVAELAANGLTNPQIGDRLFISRRTVQSHLAHIFGKLGIASRVELAAEVSRRASS